MSLQAPPASQHTQESTSLSLSLQARTLATQLIIPAKGQGTFVDNSIKSDCAAFVLMSLAVLVVAVVVFVLSTPEPGKLVSASQTTAEPPGAAPSNNPVEPKLASASPPARPNNVILALDGMRVLLIINVICSHFAIPRFPLFEGDWVQHNGMIFFTTLSGFVRFMSLKKLDTYDLKTWKPYAANVLARFGPGNSMALILFFLVSCKLGLSRAPRVAWPVEALFLSSALEALPTQYALFEHFCLAGNPVCWFTSVVVMGSLLMPLFYNLRPQQKTMQIMGVLAAVISLRALLGYPLNHCGFGLHLYQDCSFHNPLLPLIKTDDNVVVRLLEIVAGALTAQLATTMPPSLLQSQGWGWVFDGVICIVLLLNVYVARQQSLIDNAFSSKAYPLWTAQCMLVLMPILIFAAFAAAQNDGSPSSGLLGRCLAYKPLSSMAKYSFGAYIYQSPAACIMMWILSQGDHYHASGLIRTLMEWAPVSLSWLFAVASEHLLEKHIRIAVQKRIRGEAAQ